MFYISENESFWIKVIGLVSLETKTTPCNKIIYILCYFNIQKLYLDLVESSDLFEVGAWFAFLWT